MNSIKVFSVSFPAFKVLYTSPKAREKRLMRRRLYYLVAAKKLNRKRSIFS